MRLVRALTIILVALALAACSQFDNRHMVALSKPVLTRLAEIGSSPQEAMLIRIYKQSSELEVWKRTRTGAFVLFKTYAICTWSGDLGPKFREGDMQSPEGFYTVTPAQMNPKSSYWLSFNTGFPNKFDQAWGRTGTNLMVHGDCKSVGCYAVTDDQIKEIYALARESFSGGNRSFQLQLFPFRMTDANLASNAASPHAAFWANLKQGADIFEQTRQPPAWDVCEKRYVFNRNDPLAQPLDPLGACPAAPLSTMTALQ
jgi:murein L,D-transpeptidase YafK